MGDEALFAELALPVVVSPILEKVINCCCVNDINGFSSNTDVPSAYLVYF